MKTHISLISLLLLSTVISGCAVTQNGEKTPGEETRDVQAMANDETVELGISKAIYTDDSLRHLVHINVSSYNGVVLLTGEAPDAGVRSRVIEHARRVTNIKRIHNEITLGPKADLKSRSYDNWLTAKVKSRLIASKAVKSINIRVIIETQSAYLMGLVSREEGTAAADLARRVDGVKEVVTLFEYID